VFVVSFVTKRKVRKKQTQGEKVWSGLNPQICFPSHTLASEFCIYSCTCKASVFVTVVSELAIYQITAVKSRDRDPLVVPAKVRTPASG
jgi:hypothetical protein